MANAKTDVVVIGGGITGLMSAYMLSGAGHKVTLLEKGKLGEGVTADTTAFVTSVIDTTFSEIISIYGLKNAKLVIQSHEEGIKLIQHTIQKEGIECGFMNCSNYLYANTTKEAEELSKEYKAAKKLGLPAALHGAEKFTFPNAGSLEIKNQAKFSAERFVKGLAEVLRKRGVKIFQDTSARSYDSDGEKVTVKTSTGSIEAKWAIVATYEPFNKPLQLYFKKAFYVSYVMVADIEKGLIPEGIYEDMDDPYHYFRIDAGDKEDSIVIGGEDHRSDIHVNPKKNFQALRDYLDQIVPNASANIFHKRTGLILESVDGLAYMGPFDQKNVLYALAFSGNGMTYSAIAGMMFRDYVTGKENPWAEIYRVDRVPTFKSLMAKGRDYGEVFIHGALKNTMKYRK